MLYVVYEVNRLVASAGGLIEGALEAFVDGNPEVSPVLSCRDAINASSALILLLRLKRGLKIFYGLTEAKCEGYPPSRLTIDRSASPTASAFTLPSFGDPEMPDDTAIAANPHAASALHLLRAAIEADEVSVNPLITSRRKRSRASTGHSNNDDDASPTKRARGLKSTRRKPLTASRKRRRRRTAAAALDLDLDASACSGDDSDSAGASGAATRRASKRRKTRSAAALRAVAAQLEADDDPLVTSQASQARNDSESDFEPDSAAASDDDEEYEYDE